jgi:hypothetical protein
MARVGKTICLATDFFSFLVSLGGRSKKPGAANHALAWQAGQQQRLAASRSYHSRLDLRQVYTHVDNLCAGSSHIVSDIVGQQVT